MTTAVPEPSSRLDPNSHSKPTSQLGQSPLERPSRLDQLDAWCERIGDSLNPILVKETRQALKSRQFVGTFSVLLVAALGWTIIGSLSMMPGIYTTPSAPRMLIGYYIVLALPMLIVVPLAAYRSLEGEIDDGTLELLSITVLSPWQIVLGKLASAMLQMLLYFVALFPCVAYAYTLRGVDLPTTLLMMAVLLVAGIVLTILALFFAPLARTRTGRITTLLAVMMVLIGCEWALAFAMISMILEGNPFSMDQLFFVVTATLLVSVAVCHLLLAATAAQLTPESENRSTHLRLSLMALTAIVLGVGTLGARMLGDQSTGIFVMFAMFLAGLWTFSSSLMAGESSVMTPRIRRELPSSFMARATLTWLTPGPVTGLVFSVINIVVITLATVLAIDFAYSAGNSGIPAYINIVFKKLCITYAAYLIFYLVIVRWLVAGIRIRNHPRVEIGAAALVAVAVLSALIPYSIGLHFNDYRAYPYSWWQITNWAWTLGHISDRNNVPGLTETVVAAAAIAFFATLLLSPGLVMPRRTAMPARVKEELQS